MKIHFLTWEPTTSNGLQIEILERGGEKPPSKLLWNRIKHSMGLNRTPSRRRECWSVQSVLEGSQAKELFFRILTMIFAKPSPTTILT